VSANRRFQFLKSFGADQFAQELEQPVCDPPRLLETGSPRQPLRPASWRLIAVLLVLCLVPRAWRAIQLDVPCPDGTFYMQVASSLERGDYEAAFRQMPINTYPLVLAGLHHLGLDWPLAGKLWGVMLGTLTVLPLFGWLRRQTDDRVAIISSLFYAAHPTFIEWSPELVRDGTFWFLAAVTLYYGFRAVTEVRIGYYLATGLALTLAVHTRFEGWFLFIPVVLSSGWRWLALTEQRGRLLVGLVVCLGIGPALVGGAQLIWPNDATHHHWASMHRVVYVRNWLKSLVAKTDSVAETKPQPAPMVSDGPAQPAPVAGGSGEEPAKPDSKSWSEVYPHYTSKGEFELLPPRRALGMLFQTLLRGVDAVFGLCLLIGWWNWRYIWIRRDFFPLFLITVAVMLGMWIHLTQVYGSSSRYALPLALAAMPYPAVGLLTICRGLRWLANWISGRQAALAYVFAGAMLLVTAGGWIDALTAHEPGRQREAALGRWMKDEYGADRRVAFAGHLNLVGYFAQCQSINVPFYGPASSVALWLTDTDPDLLILHRRELLPGAIRVLVGEADRLGWQSVAPERLPARCRSTEFIVLARSQRVAAHAGASGADSGTKR
jgi:hypothetical protein